MEGLCEVTLPFQTASLPGRHQAPQNETLRALQGTTRSQVVQRTAEILLCRSPRRALSAARAAPLTVWLFSLVVPSCFPPASGPGVADVLFPFVILALMPSLPSRHHPTSSR